MTRKKQPDRLCFLDNSGSQRCHYVAGNKDLELTGVAAVMTANNSLYGINRANNKWFNQTILAVNAEILEIKIQEGIDIAEDEVGNTIAS